MTTTPTPIVVRFPVPAHYLNANSAGHWGTDGPVKKAWRTAAAKAATRHGNPNLRPDQYPVTIAIHFDFDNPTRRDPANYAPTAKAVVDGFGPPVDYMRQGKRVVAAGAAWWPDDGPAYVTVAPITCTYAGKVAGLYATVTITPAAP